MPRCAVAVLVAGVLCLVALASTAGAPLAAPATGVVAAAQAPHGGPEAWRASLVAARVPQPAAQGRAAAQAAEADRPAAPAAHEALVTRYCAACHNAQLQSGTVNLAELDLQRPERTAPLAERVIRKVRAGMMPPAGAPRPDQATLRAFVASLESVIDAAAASAAPRPGARPFQRLNRAEYARSIRDLLALEIDAGALLPPDPMSAGFDTIADAQTFSPAVMEGYMRAAARIAAEAIGDPAAAPTSATYSVSSTTSQMRHVEGAPFGTRGGVAVVHTFPADGEYVFTIRLQAATNGGLIGRRSPDEQIEVSIDGERVALLDVSPNLTEGTTEGLNVRSGRVMVRAGARRVAAAFLPRFSGIVDDLVAPIEFTLADAIGAAQILQVPHLQDLYITGPHTVTGISDTPSRRAVFTCRPVPDERRCATEILMRLGSQAYRRPLAPEDRDSLLAFYEEGRREGNFETGIRTALQAILASPHFVFRLERQPDDVQPGAPYRLSDLELASRLSYFLWSAPPDADLLDAVRGGALRDAQGLETQVRRMLQDRRADALSTRFAAQWLRLAQLDGMTPDGLLYPMYDQTLARALRRETELLFDSIVRDDRSVLDLLTADYTFLNERSALHYGVPGVLGGQYRRVVVSDPARQGLLGHASILTMTSNADRTSPVIRGKWVMEVLLGMPPPPPPPNVPELEPAAAGGTGRLLSVRERLEAHRANPACASCHQMIDPIGLALEPFDVTGAWRINDSGTRIDASTELYDGTPLDGPTALRQALLRYSDAIVGTFTENLLTYALGRRLSHTDMPAVRAIARDAGAQDHRFSAFVLGIVRSPAFQMAEGE